MSKQAAVSSGHHLASLTGIKILQKGGNIFDAAIATSAMLCVVRPWMCGLGGDAFALMNHADSGKKQSINSGGLAPQKAKKDIFKELGLPYIPEEGINSAGIPGLVDAWRIIFETSCSMSIADLLADAIYYANTGFPIYSKFKKTIELSFKKLDANNGTSKIYLPGGQIPKVGDLLFQKDLGMTLQQLSKEGFNSFYTGQIATAISEYCERNSGLINSNDLNNYKAQLSNPISTTYHEYMVYEQPPVSQGFMLLEMLNIIEKFDIKSMQKEPWEPIHLMVEAKKAAFDDRIRYFGDPDFIDLPIDRLISKEHADVLRSNINLNSAKNMGNNYTDPNKDTTYLCIIDSEGNGISLIQSLFTSFGSGVTIEGTGIVLNDRLMSFSLDDNHPNQIQPGKKAVHTLNSYMITKNDSLYMVGGSPGADDQVQTNLQVITNFIDLGYDIQESIEAPRWSSRPGAIPNEKGLPYELYLERRFQGEISKNLERKGHLVKIIDDLSIGAAQSIAIDLQYRTISAGADPRRDAYAIGY